MSRRSRLDVELVRRGLVASRALAQEAIAAGLVTVDGAPGRKPATAVAPQQQIVVTAPPRRWVSRGGDKLDGALADLGLDRFDGRVCLDAGASTGGFTDVLLARGAAAVIAVDVGYGQLAWRLRTDPRVRVVERTHVRDLAEADLDGRRPDLVVADLSFISLTAVLGPLRELVGRGADWCLLVKPQFEVGRASVGRGGVVRDADAWRTALDGVRDAAVAVGLDVAAATVSPLPGPAGNIEFFVRLHDASAGDVDGTSDGSPHDRDHDRDEGAGWPRMRSALIADAVVLREGTNR